MKRSEMLKILYDAVDYELATGNNKNLVDVILDKCLELEMLPPPYQDYNIGDVNNDYMVYKWEDE